MSTVARIGVPYAYIVRVGEIDSKWLKDKLYQCDLDIENMNSLIAEYLDHNEIRKQKPYKTVAVRLDIEYVDELRVYSMYTGLPIKFITHMILTIANDKERNE